MWTALCTSCGEVWEAEEEPSTCPLDGFSGIVTMPSDDPSAVALRKRHEEEK